MRLGRTPTIAVVAALSAGVLAALPLELSARGADPRCGDGRLSFGKPLRLGNGHGYEPGIEIDSKGTIFVTAHKLSLTNEGDRTASWLWRSGDNGKTFEPMSGLATEQLYAFEGDFATDARDRLYFVDTWAADNHFYRYSDHGKTLDMFRPAVATYEVDDRPWLAAHGNGFVYYLSNTGWKHDGRLTIHRSTDGGQTFDPVGYTLPRSGWGFLDADPNSKYVYAVANDVFYGREQDDNLPLEGDAHAVYAWISKDRGDTWSKPHKIAKYKFGYQVENDGHDDAYPIVGVSPKDGSVYAFWTDDGKRLMLARSTDHGKTWRTWDVTPFDGIFSFPWMAVAPNGDVGITFEADPRAEDLPNQYIYGMLWRPRSGCAGPARCNGPASAYSRVREEAVGTGGATQADFFQVDFAPDNSMHLSFRDGHPERRFEILYSRQTSGPNMSGQRFCGVNGTP
jgi:hypothetical protein